MRLFLNVGGLCSIDTGTHGNWMTMSARLQNKSVLVTAAAQGIGAATARLFAAEGAKVIATDVNMDVLRDLADTAGITTRHLDVTDDREVSGTITEIGPLDVLFNCAGYVHHGTIMDCEESDWDFSL